MARPRHKESQEHSAGGVLLRRREHALEVCLILVRSTRGRLRWQLPKGHIETAERSEEAAAREIFEETGCHGRVIATLGSCEFSYSRRSFDGSSCRVKKRVDFYLLSYESGSVRDHDGEVEEARFVSIREAEHLLAFDTEREMVRRAREIAANDNVPYYGV